MPHSPGPFTTVRGTRKHREAIFIKSGKDFVGKVYGHECQPLEANAALFAAAPDLLDACLGMSDQECHCDEAIILPCCQCVLTAAIKKARGIK